MKPLDDAKFSGTKDVDERLRIDSANLQPWIDEYVPNAGKIIAIEQFKGGQSNPTYKIITESKNLVLRRKPPGKLLPSAHAVDREYKVITALYETDVPVPKTYGLCEDDDVAGTAFFVMDFLDGDLFWDPMIPSMTNRDRKEIYRNKNKTLAKLHSVDYKKIGLEDYGKPGNYVARQVSRWSKQYRAAKLKELGIPSEREYMKMYCENSGKDLSKNWEFYMAFNMFKIAGILQGILGRVRDGTAASKHAEERGNMVFPLSEAAWSTIEENFLK